ncbi:MAG TPA: hypothetical protein VHH92_03915, partial [Actinomycetota bacterium]|nr:hypothetical protein [Actinomycetota bacterium]
VGPVILGHEAWFTDARPPFDWSFAAEPASLALIAAAVVVAVAWRLIARRLRSPEIGVLLPLGRLSPYVPRLLAIHAGVSLLAQAALGTYLAPSLDLPASPLGSAVAIAEGVVGVWLVTGYRIRPAAWLLVAAGPLGMPAYGIVPILERVDLLGVALFLSLLPPGDTTAGAVDTGPERVRPALLGLRLAVGGSLIILAFTEKLIRPGLALALLDRFPAFNVLRAIGAPVDDLTFIRVAGAVELLFGLLIVSGALPQVAVIVAGIPFNATLFFLGTEELIGHLPIYGAMLALLVYGSDERVARETSWLPRLGSAVPPATW